jgi:CheY-like chemotaxis protein
VKLYLPRTTEPVPLEAGAAAHRGSPAPHAIRRATILIVDDEEEVRRMASECAVTLGYHVLSAGNSSEALEIIKSGEKVDLLFSDIVMPGGMSGTQLAAEARRLRPEMKILLTSGYVRDGASEDGLDDIAPLLPKPYHPTDLASHFHRIMTCD